MCDPGAGCGPGSTERGGLGGTGASAMLQGRGCRQREGGKDLGVGRRGAGGGGGRVGARWLGAGGSAGAPRDGWGAVGGSRSPHPLGDNRPPRFRSRGGGGGEPAPGTLSPQIKRAAPERRVAPRFFPVCPAWGWEGPRAGMGYRGPGGVCVAWGWGSRVGGVPVARRSPTLSARRCRRLGGGGPAHRHAPTATLRLQTRPSSTPACGHAP